MAEAIGPRMYLVGRVLPVLLQLAGTAGRSVEVREVVDQALTIVDATLDEMGKERGRGKAANSS